MGWPQFLRLLDHNSVAGTPPEGVVPPVARRREVTGHPRVTSVPGRLADASAGRGLPRARRTPQQVSVSSVTRRWPQARSDPTSAPVSRDGRRLVVAPDLPRESGSSCEVAVNTVRAPIPLSSRERCGLGRSPLLTAPVDVRSPERTSVKTPENPWSRGTFKFTGLSPKLSRYPQDSCCHPPVAHCSCTAMCTASPPIVAP